MGESYVDDAAKYSLIIVLSAALNGCFSMAHEKFQSETKPIPVLNDLMQVYDYSTNSRNFVSCNPCKTPTPKTLVAALPLNENGIVPRKSDDVAQAQGQVKDNPSDKIVLKAPAMEKWITSISFTSSSYSLNTESKQVIKDILPDAQRAVTISIRGRTDSSGNIQSNRSLAMARAKAVRKEFVLQGVDPKKIKTLYCTKCFIASNDSVVGRSINRRVEIELEMERGKQKL